MKKTKEKSDDQVRICLEGQLRNTQFLIRSALLCKKGEPYFAPPPTALPSTIAHRRQLAGDVSDPYCSVTACRMERSPNGIAAPAASLRLLKLRLGLALLQLLGGSAAGVRLEGNVYDGLLVAINPFVPEDQKIIDNVKVR